MQVPMVVVLCLVVGSLQPLFVVVVHCLPQVGLWTCSQEPSVWQLKTAEPVIGAALSLMEIEKPGLAPPSER